MTEIADLPITSHRRAAIVWMRANMNVVALFEKFAGQMVERRKKFGINLLRERVRWQSLYEYDKEEYKFCNSFSPYVARYLLHKHPEWKAFMRCKACADEREIRPITDEDLGISFKAAS